MNNTIPSVPRELLADLLGNDHDKRIMAERHLLAMLANAPSPAGVDGLEVVGTVATMGFGRHCISADFTACDKLKVGDSVTAMLPTKAIIDGLRGEVADLRSMLATVSKAGLRVRTERDQQAQRIGELEGLLRGVHGWIDESARVYRHNSTSVMLYRIDAALSAGKDSAK